MDHLFLLWCRLFINLLWFWLSNLSYGIKLLLFLCSRFLRNNCIWRKHQHRKFMIMIISLIRWGALRRYHLSLQIHFLMVCHIAGIINWIWASPDRKLMSTKSLCLDHVHRWFRLQKYSSIKLLLLFLLLPSCSRSLLLLFLRVRWGKHDLMIILVINCYMCCWGILWACVNLVIPAFDQS